MPRSVLFVVAGTACFLAGVFLWSTHSQNSGGHGRIALPSEKPAHPAAQPVDFEPQMPAAPQGSGGPAIGIIIDDFGASRHYVDSWLALPSDIVIAVIPHLPMSARIAAEARERGFDVFLHQPMEPHTFPDENPGRYGIYRWQSQEEITAILNENISSLGVPLAGVNNHMGSRATEDTRLMRAFFSAFPKNLVFLDSRTSSHSVAYDIARSQSIPALHNDVFLDASTDSVSIQSAYTFLLKIAKKRGFAIGLGHVHSPHTLKCLEDRLPHLAEEGIRLVRLRPLPG